MRVLVTGASGKLGAYVVKALAGHEVIAWQSRQQVDLGDPKAIARGLEQARAEVIIHTAAMSAIAECHQQPELARRINCQAVGQLAGSGARLIHVSTDLVFGGDRAPYCEDDPPQPLSVYGRTKAEAEPLVVQAGGTVVRVALLFGPSSRGGFFDSQLANLRAGKPMSLFVDEWRTPLYLGSAAEALALLVDHPHPGLLHVGGSLRMSRYEMGRALAEAIGADPELIRPNRSDEVDFPEPRPTDVSLASDRFRTLFPAWNDLTVTQALAGR